MLLNLDSLLIVLEGLKALMLIAYAFHTNAENQGQNTRADVIFPSVNSYLVPFPFMLHIWIWITYLILRITFHLRFGEYVLEDIASNIPMYVLHMCEKHKFFGDI